MKTAEEMLMEKEGEMVCIAPDASIHDALETMLAGRIGAILVKDNEEIVGIWTERDLMRDVVQSDFDAKTARIKDYMTTDLVSTSYDATIYHLKDNFLGRRLRHLLVEKDGKYIGILSAGDVMRASLDEKTEELDKLNAIVSWEFYENWKWKKKKS